MVILAVSVLWQWGAIFLLGSIGGIIICVKWIAPPEEDINIEFGRTKFKIKGKNHNLSDVIDISDVFDMSDDEVKKLSRKEKRAIRRVERIARRRVND